MYITYIYCFKTASHEWRYTYSLQYSVRPENEINYLFGRYAQGGSEKTAGVKLVTPLTLVWKVILTMMNQRCWLLNVFAGEFNFIWIDGIQCELRNKEIYLFISNMKE